MSNNESLKIGSQPNFPQIIDLGPRPWGTEELLFIADGKFMMKKLTIKKGSKGGFQFHRVKDEGGILISGLLLVRFDDGSGGIAEKTISPGESFHFPPGVPHQEEALEDCIIIEGSTVVFNDRVRVEKEYGLGEPIGLPTTQIHEIKYEQRQIEIDMK